MASMMYAFSAQGILGLSVYAGLLTFGVSMIRASISRKLMNWLPKRLVISCKARDCLLASALVQQATNLARPGQPRALLNTSKISNKPMYVFHVPQ